MSNENGDDINILETQKFLQKSKKTNKYALAISILASTTSILLGYDTGVMSGATIYIKEDLNITDVEVEVLVGTISIFSLIGSAAAGRTSDWIGRRYTVVSASAFFFLGAVLMAAAANYAWLMVGRFFARIRMGYALVVAPVYAAEVSPAAARGSLTTFPEVFVNVGLLLGYVSNYAFSGLPTASSWRVMLGLGAIPSIFLATGVVAMPESPRWLVMHGRLDDAWKVLDLTSDSLEDSRMMLDDIMRAAGLPEDSQNDVVWRELFLSPTPAIKHILVAGIGVHLLQQASGTDAVVLYSPRIFEKAGLRKDSDKLLATVAVGISKLVFTLAATFLVDRVGRRPLLLTSCGGIAASMLGLAVGLAAADEAAWATGLCVAASLSCIAFFSMGMGPVAWVYSSEVFPLRLRAQGCAVGVAVNRLASAVVSMTFISLYESITIGGAFFLYAGIAGFLGFSSTNCCLKLEGKRWRKSKRCLAVSLNRNTIKFSYKTNPSSSANCSLSKKNCNLPESNAAFIIHA